MAEYADREHYIPVRRSELVEMLAADKDLPDDRREPFRQFCQLIAAIFHFELQKRLDTLKDAYAPFDPDAETRPLQSLGPEEKQQRLDALLNEFIELMERANFQHLDHEALRTAINAGSSDWGLSMDVDFSVFERLEVFARGDGLGTRTRRRWYRLWKPEEVQVPTYQRLVLILKLRPHKRLGTDVDTADVYLKLFKDIPKLDLEMLLPGARLKMPTLERGKLGASLVSTFGWVGYKIAQEISQLATALVQRNALAFWAPLSLVLGYGYKQYSGFQTSKQSYSLMLTKSLYFQNLDNNAGVITRLLDEAEEQECREAILAYYYLWRHAGERGWTSADLDDYAEHDLEGRTGIKIDFEIDDALAKLVRLQLVEQIDDSYRAVPVERALQRLDHAWDNYFNFNEAGEAKTPVAAAAGQ